jgi:hypothetical protein
MPGPSVNGKALQVGSGSPPDRLEQRSGGRAEAAVGE